MNFTSLLIGVLIGIIGSIATGFLRKGGEDSYYWLKGKINPKSIKPHSPQVIVNLHSNEDGSLEKLALTEVEHLSSIHFDDIAQAIETAPPLQQQDIGKNFVGLNIEWTTYLQYASQRDDGNVYLRLSIDKVYMGRGVVCEVPRDEYRELSILKKGAAIRVSGEIVEAGSMDIKLTNARLVILSENDA